MELCGGSARSMNPAEPALNLKQAPKARTWARGRVARQGDVQNLKCSQKALNFDERQKCAKSATAVSCGSWCPVQYVQFCWPLTPDKTKVISPSLVVCAAAAGADLTAAELRCGAAEAHGAGVHKPAFASPDENLAVEANKRS